MKRSSVGKKRHLKALLCSLLTMAVCAPAAFGAETDSDLKQQIEILQKKVDAIEKKQGAAETPGGHFLGKSDTVMTIGGYVKFDMIYSDVSAGAASGADQLFTPKAIPVGSSNEGDQLVAHARQSRIFVRTETPSEYGAVKTHVEGDFFGAGNNTFRLRHAYGELNGVLAGQTWSTFMDAGSLPETLDFNGPVGVLFCRQAQLRVTRPFSNGSVQVALEDPETTLIDNATASAPDDDRTPDVVGRVNLNTGLGNFAFIGIARQLCVDTPAVKDSVWGGAGSISGTVPVFGKDKFQFQLNYGNALGRYMPTCFADAMVDNGEIKAVDQWGGYASYRHFWTAKLRSTLVYSYGEADYDTKVVANTVADRYQSVHANLLWSPVPQVTAGVEYLWGEKKLMSGEKGDLNRCQASIQYNFF